MRSLSELLTLLANEHRKHIDGHRFEAVEEKQVLRILERHGLATSPAWMSRLLEKIANKETLARLERIPSGYPMGENGLVNVLLDINSEIVSLSLDEHGESLYWEIVPFDLVVSILRETAGPGNLVAIRKLGTDVNGWIVNQLRGNAVQGASLLDSEDVKLLSS